MGGLWARWRAGRGRRRGRRAARSLDPGLRATVRAAYDEGRPIPEPLARKAAEAGDPRGMTVYGIGLGKRGAYAEAIHWLGKAAATGDISAMVVLGTLHLDLGDPVEAERHFRRAADRGHAGARLALQQLRARRNGSGP
ncbi:sel1 repeat family protein [Streptomyces hygroscopicus subsp. hygroscopicus]|uniref:TPR repeat protein n=1 Tax=Streptomyces demainii TaxID=588122 RepID=A0ABT9L004_9ACTN|nr:MULTISPECIES: SEL1-like repeat protein [Streptomyces]MBW8087797.1 sel1 repeat family protein [Streptomyces hygroscopicus subsp. hygroscopicus]MCO8303021.1 SEL1-like repeat protein [Streptomyces sp. RKCA744]MDN3056527.1 SEL1-like repeat protein [Streptomyces sp. SRF1]MDP9614023.1 TPR repeat protein [Streptomyces demainii]